MIDDARANRRCVLHAARRTRRRHADAEPAAGRSTRCREAMLDALQARARRARRRRDGARRRDRRRGQGVLRRPRPEGDARRAVARLLRAPVRAVRAHDAGDPAPAGAGDRARAGHRHRGRLPAGRDVRPGGRRAATRASRSAASTSACSARRRASRCRATSARKAAFEMLVTGDFICADEARAKGLVNRVAAPRRARRRGRGAGRRASSPSRASRSRMGKAAVLPPARAAASRRPTSDAGRDDGLQHDGPSALEGVQAFIDKRPPSWSVARGQDASFARDADRGGSGDCPAVARHETP